MEAGESLHSQDTRLAENQVSPCAPPRPTGEAPLVDLVFSPLKRQIDLDGDIEVLQIIQQFPNQLDFWNHGYLGKGPVTQPAGGGPPSKRSSRT